MDTFSNWLCDHVLNPVCIWLDAHLCDEAVVAWVLSLRITYMLYSKALRVLARTDEYYRFWLFGVHGSNAYNTNVTLSFSTCRRFRYPRWSCTLCLSYEYDWHGRRTGKIKADFNSHHWGVLDHVWHEVMNDKDHAAIEAERKALNWAQNTVW